MIRTSREGWKNWRNAGTILILASAAMYVTGCSDLLRMQPYQTVNAEIPAENVGVIRPIENEDSGNGPSTRPEWPEPTHSVNPPTETPPYQNVGTLIDAGRPIAYASAPYTGGLSIPIYEGIAGIIGVIALALQRIQIVRRDRAINEVHTTLPADKNVADYAKSNESKILLSKITNEPVR